MSHQTYRRLARSAVWRLFELTCRACAAALRLLPRRERFAGVLLLGRIAEPLVRRTRFYRGGYAKVDGAAELALYEVIDRLTRYRVEFDPVLEVENYTAVRTAVARGKGVVLLAPHTMLMYLLFRRLHDDGLAPVGLSSAAYTPLIGTTFKAHTLQPSTGVLLTVRSLLRRGALFCGMPDESRNHDGRTIRFDTLNGPVAFSPALMQVAARAGACVLFTAVHVERGRVRATIVEPGSPTVAGLAEDFRRFVLSHVERSRTQ